MPEIKGYKLYVNLGATQTRRRLKGFGHGVRKVETAGRKRAVIIHTATGRNLQALQAKFADVGHASTEQGLNGPPVPENENRLNLPLPTDLANAEDRPNSDDI